MNMISNPFKINPFGASDEFQLELIDIHNDSNLKTAYDQHDLDTFTNSMFHQSLFLT